MSFILRLLGSAVVFISVLQASSPETGPGIGNAVTTCARLQASIGSDIVELPSGKDYLSTVRNPWNLLNTEQRPSCIVFPSAASHVQSAMAAIFEDRVHYAVQAGGHSAMKGWNNVNNGVLIVFSRMANVSYDALSDTVTLQPGVHWSDAIAQLEQFGVAPMGGRVGDVGTGLLLGGGLSFLSAEHGFSADAFKELDVVLVSGQLVTATATNEYSDLFRALKGGANRFGIVTRYEVHPVHTGTNADKNWFGGLIFYANSSAEAVVKATANYVRNTKDPRAALLVVFMNSVSTTGELLTGHLITLFFQGSDLPQDIFGEFLSIPSLLISVGPVSYAEAAGTLRVVGDSRTGQLFGASSLVGDPEAYMNAFTKWNNYTAAVKDSVNTTILAFTPILDSQIVAGQLRGGNAIDPPRGSYAALQFQTSLLEGALEIPEDVVVGRQLLFQQIPRSLGIPLYINECDESQDVFASYGQFEFLKKTYTKYDPTRFNVQFTEGPIGL